MASKRRLRRQKLAAARNEGVKMPKEKMRVRWDSANARWVDEHGREVNGIAPPEGTKPAVKETPKAQALYLYNVAVQKGAKADIVCCEFMAPNDEEVLELICRHYAVKNESEFTVFDVHRILGGDKGIVVVREGPDWPKGVKTVTHRGIVSKGQWGVIADKRAELKAAAQATTKTTTNRALAKVETSTAKTALPWAEGETYIPRVRYTLLTGS